MNGTMNEVSLSGSSSPAGEERASAHSLSAAKLLEVWEYGQLQAQVERALTLLSVAYPDASRETLAALTIGQRDALLIALREQLFGDELISLTDCPACNERLELTFSVQDIRASPESEADAGVTLLLNQAGYELQLHVPNSLDLLQLRSCSSLAMMRDKLLEQCVPSITHQGRTQSPEHLKEMPSEIVDQVIERIREADPQADVEVSLHCPVCQHGWATSFDIVSYLWTELQSWATQLLREVHLLASSYGWREADILNMSSRRRRSYLQLLLV